MRWWFATLVLVMPLALLLGLAAYAIRAAAPPHERLDAASVNFRGANGQTAVPRLSK